MDNESENTVLQLVINGTISQREAAKRLKVHHTTIGRKVRKFSNGSHVSCSNNFNKKLKSARPELFSQTLQKVFSGELSRSEAAESLQVTTQAIDYHVCQYKKIGPVVSVTVRPTSDLDGAMLTREASVGNLGLNAGQQADSGPSADEEPMGLDMVHHSPAKNKSGLFENKTTTPAPFEGVSASPNHGCARDHITSHEFGLNHKLAENGLLIIEDAPGKVRCYGPSHSSGNVPIQEEGHQNL